MDDDELEELIAEAKAIARRPAEERERWLAELEARIEDGPQTREFLESVRGMIDSTREINRAKLGCIRADEQLETSVIKMVELFVGGKLKLPKEEATLGLILHILIEGHLLPGVRERLAQPDAQKLLAEWKEQYLTPDADADADAEPD